MSQPARFSVLACLILLGSWSPPAAYAAEEKVTALPPRFTWYDGAGGAFVVAACAAHAAPGATGIMARCTVGGSLWVARVPEDSPVVPDALIWNFSQTDLPGSAATAIWIGADPPPADVCSYAEATFSALGGGDTHVVTDGPYCVRINASDPG